MSSPHSSPQPWSNSGSPGPAPDAIVVRTGRRNTWTGSLALGVVALIFGLGTVAPLFREGTDAVDVLKAVGILAVLFGGLGWLLRMIWKGRSTRLAFDQQAVWFSNGKAEQAIPWHSLAGAGLYSSPFGRGNRMYTLELCPGGPIDRDDPVLWTTVRDEEPLRPGLPTLRYRIHVGGSHAAVADAVQRCAPQLWFGHSERKAGHFGKPDVKGHRARTGGRTR